MDKKLRLSLIFQAAGNVRGFLGGVRSDTDKTGRALSAARERVQALQRSTRDVSAFRQLETRLAGTRSELSEARTEALRLGAAMDATETPTRQMARAFDLAKTKVQALERQQEGQVRGLGDLKRKLEAAGVSTEALGAHELRLARDLKAANAELATQARRMDDVADRQRRMGAARAHYDKTQQLAGSAQGAGFSALGAGAVVGAPLLKGNEAAQDLETRMTTIAQRSNMSADATNRFEKALLATGEAANRTRDETLTMFDQLTAQGFEMNDALAMGRDVGRASTAYQVGDEDLAATAGSLRNVGLVANQTGRAFDVMAVAGKRGNFEFDAMAKSFPSLTAGAAAYGMTGLKAVAEIAAAAQIARRGAGSDDEAATNLNNLLQKIGSPETEKKFAKMGVNLRAGLAAGAAQGKSALETIIELTQKATGGDASMLGRLFEDAQVQKALRPLMKDFADFKDIRDDALSANGEVDRDFQRRMKDNAQAVKDMRIEAGTTAVRMGKDIMPVFTAIAGAVRGVLTRYNSWASANPGLARTVTMVVAAVAAGLLVFGGLALAVSAVLGPFALLRFTLFQTGMFFGPLGRVIGGFAGRTLPFLGRGLMIAGRGFLSFGAAAGRALPILGRGLMIAGRGFLAFGAAAARAGLMLLANPITWIVLGIVAAVALLAGAAYLIYRNWGAISAWFGGVWTAIKTAASSAIGFIGRIFSNFHPVGILIGAIMRAWPALQALGGRFLSLGRHLLSGLINGVLGGIPALVRAVMGAGSRIITGFKERLGIRSPSRVFAQLGDYTMQGIGVGITRSADNPLRRMRDVAGALTAAGAIAAPGLAFAGSLGPPPDEARRVESFGSSGPAGDRFEREPLQFESGSRLQPSPAATSAARPAAGVTIGTLILKLQQQPGQDAAALAQEIIRMLQSPNLGEFGDDDDSYGEAD